MQTNFHNFVHFVHHYYMDTDCDKFFRFHNEILDLKRSVRNDCSGKGGHWTCEGTQHIS